ncbi:retrovirus-related pol polyprotein from transposon TNT 1-94, partial [Tanacetum coccineum]
ALETDRIQLKDTITSLRIQLDGLKLSALTTQHTKLQAQVTSKTSSGPSTSETSKVLAPGMYNLISKYIPPPKRANWVKTTPLPKKKQVTFQEPPKTSNRPTQKPPVQQNKKPNVSVNLSTRTKPATESRKPMPKSHTRNYRILPSKSVNARRAADHNKKLNFVNHNQFVIRSLKSVNTKTPQAKHSVNHTKKVWKATRTHNVNTTKTPWRPTRKVVGSVKPQWKPTGRYFALYDNCPLTRIMEPIVEPLELTPSVSSSSKVTMISRFTDCKLSDRKAGSTGLSGKKGPTADSIGDSLKRPTAYNFRQIDLSFWSCVPRSPQQNGVVERRNRTLMEAARTMLIFAKAPLFLWAEAGKKPNLQYFRVFGSLCYPTNDYDDVGKLKAKADIGIFVGYAPTKKAYRIYNKRTRKIQETVHVTFDELTEGLTSVQTSLGLVPQQMTYVPNSIELELTALQSGRSRSALVKDPNHLLSSSKKQVTFVSIV